MSEAKPKPAPMWEEWVIDAGMFSEDGLVCFVPVENKETFVFGMNVISDECPGKLIGVIHEGGQEAVEEWCERNPDWHNRYSNKETS